MLEQRLQYALDRIEIQDTISRYAQGQDSHQGNDGNVLEQWDETFTPDGTVDYTIGGTGTGPEGIVSYRELAKWMRGDGTTPGRLNAFSRWQHMLGLPIVTVDGDAASGWTDYFAVHKGQGPLEGKSVYSVGIYHDDLARTENGWRIRHRRLETLFMDVVEGNHAFS